MRSALTLPVKKLKQLVPDFDALAGEVGQVTVPVFLLLYGRGEDDHVVGAHPLPRPGGAPLLRYEEQRHDLAPSKWSRPLSKGQCQIAVNVPFLQKKGEGRLFVADGLDALTLHGLPLARKWLNISTAKSS